MPGMNDALSYIFLGIFVFAVIVPKQATVTVTHCY